MSKVKSENVPELVGQIIDTFEDILREWNLIEEGCGNEKDFGVKNHSI